MTLLDCIGQSPLLYLERISRILGAHIYAKLETANPGASIKSRVALAYVRGAMQRGELQTGGCVVEASSGNLALALAQACVKLDLRLILCMPDSLNFVDKAHRLLLHHLGAHVFLSPAEHGMEGARAMAAFKHQDTWGSFRPDPFNNPDGPQAYYEGLGAELLADAHKFNLPLDAFVCGIGSGATFSGVGQRLREENADIFLGAVEPAESAVLSGQAPGAHGISGIGVGFIPTVLKRSLISQVLTVSTHDARKAQQRLLGMEGLLAGLSSGANLHAALLLAQQPCFKGKTILTIIHDGHVG